MQMQKRRFRIGDLAKQLKVDKFVIRFWEKEFTLSPTRSCGGQRFYEEKDFEKFQQIKTLLYEKKFTIAGAKEQLKDNTGQKNNLFKDLINQKGHSKKYNSQLNNSNRNNNILCATLDNVEQKDSLKEKRDIIQKALELRENLVKLRKLLD